MQKHKNKIAILLSSKKGSSSITGPESRWLNTISEFSDEFDMYYISKNIEILNKAKLKYEFEISSWNSFSKFFQLRNFLRSNDIKYILSNGDILYDFYCAAACIFIKTKFFIFRPVIIKDLINLNYFKRLIFQALNFFIFMLANRIIFCSHDGAKRSSIVDKIFKSKFLIIHNGYKIIKDKSFVKNSSIINIGMAAHFSKFKGWDDFLKTALLCRHDNLIKFHIYGDGDLKSVIQSFINEHGLKNISLHGYVKNQTNIFSNLDIYLHTSYREGLSVSIIQALHFELPVICYRDVGGNSELVNHDINGYLIQKGDTDEIFEKICYLTSNPLALKNMSQNSKKHSTHFTQANMVKGYKDIFRK